MFDSIKLYHCFESGFILFMIVSLEVKSSTFKHFLSVPNKRLKTLFALKASKQTFIITGSLKKRLARCSLPPLRFVIIDHTRFDCYETIISSYRNKINILFFQKINKNTHVAYEILDNHRNREPNRKSTLVRKTLMKKNGFSFSGTSK